MRVNVDSQAQNDPRMHLLGRHLGINVFEAMGRILRVWFVCYERRSAVIQPIEIDIASDRDGFAEAMIASGLANRDGAGIYVCGVLNRIRFLETQQRKGLKSGEVRRQYAEMRAPVQQGFAFGSTDSEPVFNRGSQPVRTYSPAPDLDLDPALDLDRPPRLSGSDEPKAPRARHGTQDESTAPEAPQNENVQPGASQEPSVPARELPAEAHELAQLLLGYVLDNHPGNRMHKWPERQREQTAARWADSVDKLHRIDRLSWSEIQGMITWCQRDPFWQGVILGADNLRDKWDKMAAQRSRPRGSPQHAQGVEDFEQVLEDAARDIEAKKAKEPPK